MTSELMDRPEAAALSADQVSRFELAPPRHFLLPAILLLLSEEPGYGYGLVKKLREFRFGHVDRPSVYRALALLEKDRLVESWSGVPTAGQVRRVYGLTTDGERALRAWMSVIHEERLLLDDVLRRYQATGTVDSALATVEGGWTAVIGQAQSPASSTSMTHWGSRSFASAARRDVRPSSVSTDGCAEPIPSVAVDADDRGAARRFCVVPERSVLLIEARSTVGPISFGAVGLTGHMEAAVRVGGVVAGTRPTASLKLAVEELRSGNSLYDAELHRRIDARRFPVVSIELRDCIPIGSEDRYRLAGVVSFHGMTRPVEGTVTVRVVDEHKLVVSGEQVLDMRDFNIASPTVLMLRIYPDVRVRLHLEAELAD